MPIADLFEGRLLVNAEFREKAIMQSIPGTKWNKQAQVWELPLSWASCQALRGSFGVSLDIGDALMEWAKNHKGYVDYLEALKTTEHNEPFGFQKNGTDFLFSARHALLADEMGLGKSKQVIDAIVRAYEVGTYDSERVLIVCPNTMKYTWADEWAKWAPDYPVFVLDGTLPKKKKMLENEKGIFIVNWESLRKLSRLSGFGSIALTESESTPGPLNCHWLAVVADEAHRSKDHKAQQTRALWAIGEDAIFRYALTGTPIANSPVDVWSIMHFVAPENFPNRPKYIDRYCLASYNIFGGLVVQGLNPRTEDEFFNIMKPHFLRRTKAEVLDSLPEKTYQTRYVEMSTKQKKAYKSMKEDMIAEIDGTVTYTTDVLVQVGGLVQMAAGTPILSLEGKIVSYQESTKVNALLEILEEAPGESLVVFAHNRAVVDFAIESLAKAGYGCVRLSGAESAEDKANAVARFQAGEVQVIVLTTGAGGEGITLTRSNRCVFLQHPWSNVQYLQAQDRIHRIGQTRGVQIIDLVTRETIEEDVVKALLEKDVTLQELCRDPQWVRRVLTK